MLASLLRFFVPLAENCSRIRKNIRSFARGRRPLHNLYHKNRQLKTQHQEHQRHQS